jgi:hypothetical protein
MVAKDDVATHPTARWGSPILNDPNGCILFDAQSDS